MKRRHAALLVGLAVLFASCGIPISSGPSTVPRHRVPFALLSPSIPTSTTTTQPTATYAQEQIYLFNAQGFAVALNRDVLVPATLQSVLSALLAGPTSTEVAVGITSALPPQGKILDVIQVGSLATINLNAAFASISSAKETQAIGQLVLTATAQQNVTAVLFEIKGKAISVPVSGGAVTGLPVSAGEYQSLLG
jgi:hypothetical protein